MDTKEVSRGEAGRGEKSSMKFSVQTDNLKMLREALDSNCDKVRFGPEFCEWKIPSLSALKRAYALTKDKGKSFTYVTPRLSDNGLKKIRKQLIFLKEKGKDDIIINDLGMLNILGRYSELTPHLGRQLVHVPARCPWLKMSGRDALRAIVFSPRSTLEAKIRKRRVEEIYSQTSLNYAPTIRFFQGYGVQGVDLDWIPRCFTYFDFLAKAGLNLSVHLHLVPVTLTRKCHTARFLGEKTPETCSRPCNRRAFLLKHKGLGLKLFLHGNVVFRLIQPSKREMKKLSMSNVSEFVITMNPITKILNQHKIDELMLQMQ